MKKYSAIFILSTAMSACQTTELRPQDLHTYLQSYIGQSSESIQKQLNLKQMGYQSSPPILNTNQLIYTVYQPINIPIATNVDPANPIALSSTSYDVSMKCNVIFNLEHGVAHSISYEGKAC